MNEDLADNLKESLSDLSDEHFFQRRDRSCSNDCFDLPPLPEMDDNKDLERRGSVDFVMM